MVNNALNIHQNDSNLFGFIIAVSTFSLVEFGSAHLFDVRYLSLLHFCAEHNCFSFESEAEDELTLPTSF